MFGYIDIWGKNIASLARAIRASYHRTIQDTPSQSLLSRNIMFNLTSVVDWRVIPAGKMQQLDIDDVQENARRVMHDYAFCDLVYV